MKIKQTCLDGVYEIKYEKFEDHRGIFVKTFNAETFREYGLKSEFKESFYSVSKKNVLRGMHFQLAPHDHVKLVYVIDGKILDVVVDIRKGTSKFGSAFFNNIVK